MGEGFTFKPVALGMVFAVLTMFTGQVVAMVVGAAEPQVEHWIESTLAAHPDNPDLANKSPAAIASKSFRYILRGHFHGTGIGALSVGLILALASSWVGVRWKRNLALAVGVGGFLYPLCWLGAGLLMPYVGKAAAKHAFDWLVFPAVGVHFAALCVILWVWWVSFRSPTGVPDGYEFLKQ